MEWQPFNETLRAFEDKVFYGSFREGPPNTKAARGLDNRSQFLYALALMDACRKESSEIRMKSIIKNRGHYMEKAFEILDANEDRKISDLFPDLIANCVIEPHLKTTLRKMGQGQKCSLRFYPEGNYLIPTGQSVAAGYSQNRLGNVLGMLADLGFCSREGGRFSLTEKGRSLLS